MRFKILKTLTNTLVKCFSFTKKGQIESFTYYIPSPPNRKTGYREKAFDSVFHSFINQGYEILHILTQNNSNPEHSGMWIICIARSKKIGAQKPNFDLPQTETSIDNINEIIIEQNQNESEYIIEK